MQQQKVKAHCYCFNADCKFFDIGADIYNQMEAIRLYEKSASLNNSKAMMALARIYEQGIAEK